MTRPPLEVHLYGRHVASVLDAGLGDTAVQYTEEATAAPVGCRLSISLPVRRGLYPSGSAGGVWVRSLLPEGRALAWAVEHFGVPENDRYGLIEVLGRDVAGAVQVLGGGETPTAAGRYEAMSEDEVVAHVARAHTVPLGLDRRRGVRLSLAGLQDKVLLHRVDDTYMLPVDGAPSTLIVKPEPRAPRDGDGLHFAGFATNELFCLLLAQRCGLSAAQARVETFGDNPALVVQRFDRTVGHDALVSRVHQEDLLGALGIDPLLKYETPHAERIAEAGGWGDNRARTFRRGPSLNDLAQILEEHISRVSLTTFLEAATFNIVIGNADAHARNYSVLLPSDGVVQLAPLYDLVCTRMWDRLDSDAAHRINGVDHIDDVRAADLAAEAVEWGLPERLAHARVDALLTAVAEQAPATIEACVNTGGDEAVASALATIIARRVETIRT